eukprot:CAMPEP_0175089752 /NCGR_PEP_ID=MMETSP0086_2-20121207/954_1 /TAXON_ID=136419 /ORGANISM="Unknown Unknown, Strain D1" /LENGTH=246 /DNA_ID=CAMNT_0016362283 /DNA_START=85 /DNA_END=825 /DNA_ORIENTATION=+
MAKVLFILAGFLLTASSACVVAFSGQITKRKCKGDNVLLAKTGKNSWANCKAYCHETTYDDYSSDDYHCCYYDAGNDKCYVFGPGFRTESAKNKAKKMSEFIPESCTTMQPTPGHGFRVQVSGCPVQQYQIASAQFPQMCVDGSKKRFALKKCGGTATDSNTFSVQKHGDGGSTVLLENKGRCLLPTSVVKGPCKGGVTLVKTGAFHMIDTGEGECWNTASRRVLTMAKCDPENRKQRFRLVPIFS